MFHFVSKTLSQISSNLREEAKHSYYDESSTPSKPKSMMLTALGYYVVDPEFNVKEFLLRLK